MILEDPRIFGRHRQILHEKLPIWPYLHFQHRATPKWLNDLLQALTVIRRRFRSTGVRSESVRDPFGIRSGSVQANFGPNFSEPKIQNFSICAAVAVAAGASQKFQIFGSENVGPKLA